MHLVHVVAADIGEHVGILAGAPVHEVRVPIGVRLVHFGVAQLELAEKALAILPAGQQRPIVQPLVVLDADNQAFLVSLPFDLQRLIVPQHERLDAANVLLVPDCLLEDHVVQLIGHGHDHDVALAHPGNHFAEQVGVFLRRIRFQRRMGLEGLAGKSLPQARIFGKRPQGTAVEGADVDFADQAEPLQLVERRQDLHLRDHSAADNAYVWFGHRVLLSFEQTGESTIVLDHAPP